MAEQDCRCICLRAHDGGKMNHICSINVCEVKQINTKFLR